MHVHMFIILQILVVIILIIVILEQIHGGILYHNQMFIQVKWITFIHVNQIWIVSWFDS